MDNAKTARVLTAAVKGTGKDAKPTLVAKEEVDLFVRRPELEGYFLAITDGPVSKITSKEGGLRHDPGYYTPNTIDYFAARGFYPFCFDVTHNKLSVLVNRGFKFPLYLVTPTVLDEEEGKDGQLEEFNESNAVVAFSSGFECHCPVFMSSVPPAFAKAVNGSVENIEFKFVPEEIFNGVLPYVKDPDEIALYNMRRRIFENRHDGVITKDCESEVSEMLNLIMRYAVTNHATDVHVEYTGSAYRVRVRIDGELKDYPVPLDGNYYSALLAVIRIRCDLEPSEHFRPQDGAFQFDCSFVDENKISSYYDVRVSVIPQVDGKLNAVLRIQPKGEFKRLDELGFNKTVYVQVKRLCKEPHGLILVTGPTGCGKTTTLYSILNELNTPDVKIVTVEDPPEIRMDGPMQVGINEKQGRTFPTMLRSFLRHDPDIILVGEVRDSETALIAINAANTGHMVLSTLHTNDAVSAIKRLGNMDGVDPADFAFSLRGVLAQRLIKTFRPDIRELTTMAIKTGAPISSRGAYDILSQMIEKGTIRVLDMGRELNAMVDEALFPEGVVTCFGGEPEAFSGRTAITEFWKLGTKAANLIFDKRFSTIELMQVALEDDRMIPMAVTGLEKVANGETSLDHMLKGVGAEAIRFHKDLILRTYFGGCQ